MGEYYNWINVDKREYLCPGDFGYDNSRTTSAQRGTTFLCVLKELLATDWNGDGVFFLGDEAKVPADSESTVLQKLYQQSVLCGYPGNGYDTICETYRNISGCFSESEAWVRGNIENTIRNILSGNNTSSNEYGIDISAPYKGLFQRRGRDYKYTVNYSKRVCYSFPYTKVMVGPGEELEWADPLPILMHLGRDDSMGPWVGDTVGVSDTKPEGYSLLREILIDW